LASRRPERSEEPLSFNGPGCGVLRLDRNDKSQNVVHKSKMSFKGMPNSKILFKELIPAARIFPLIRRLQVFARFVERALGVVLRLESLAVFIGGAVALSGNVEDLA